MRESSRGQRQGCLVVLLLPLQCQTLRRPVLALPLDPAPLPPPSPGEFARQWLWKRELTATDRRFVVRSSSLPRMAATSSSQHSSGTVLSTAGSEARRTFRRRYIERENCFPLGRCAELVEQNGYTSTLCSGRLGTQQDGTVPSRLFAAGQAAQQLCDSCLPF